MRLAMLLSNRTIAVVIDRIWKESTRGRKNLYYIVEHDGLKETWLVHDPRRRFVSTPSPRLIKTLQKRKKLQIDIAKRIVMNRSSFLMSWATPMIAFFPEPVKQNERPN